MKGRKHDSAVYKSLMVVCVVFVFSLVAAGSPAHAAKLARLEGAAKLKRGGESGFSAAAPNTRFYPGSILKTEENSKAFVNRDASASPDDGGTALGRNTTLNFVSGVKRDGATHAEIEIPRGIARLAIRWPPTKPVSTCRVTTPSASVDFLLSKDEAPDVVIEAKEDGDTQITVIWGEITVTSASQGADQVRTLTPCDTVTVGKGGSPSEVTRVGAADLRALVTRTTITGTLPEVIPTCSD